MSCPAWITTTKRASWVPQPLARFVESECLKTSLEKGHPYSHCEVKPLTLWQRICEHHGVTHIVDFSPGSAGLAIAAAGAMEYEGVATNEVHCNWLDSTLDLVVKYLASKDKVFAK